MKPLTITQSQFAEKGFLVVRKFYNTESLYRYAIQMEPYGISDDDVPNAAAFYNDGRMVMLQEWALEKIEKLVGLELYKTYVYYRVYNIGDKLKAHTDRPACEISITLNLGYKGKPWALWMSDKENVPHEVILEKGDMVIYLGCTLSHWRLVNESSSNYAQVFLHYVDKNGPNKWAKDDARK